MRGSMQEDIQEQDRLDLTMAGIEEWHWHHRWTRPEVYYVRALRKTERRRDRSAGFLQRVIYLAIRWKFKRLSDSVATHIPLGVFGPGLSIAHLGTVTVNSDARVGARCRLHPGVTIGATHGRSPVIGSDVFIGPNAVLVGGVSIGDRVHIGPGAVITDDIPPDTLVVAPTPIVRNRKNATWQSTRNASSSS